MSKERYINAVGIGKKEKNDKGEWLCRWCGKVCPGRRSAWCSEECLHEASLRTNPSYMRSCVEERDKGVCKKCGLDTRKIVKLVSILQGGGIRYNPDYGKEPWTNPYLIYLLRDNEIWGYDKDRFYRKHYVYSEDNPRPNSFTYFVLQDLLEPLGIDPGHCDHYWEADHIIPVSEGGGLCGLENMQTLCIQCHKAETRELAKKQAIKRDPQQRLFNPNEKER